VRQQQAGRAIAHALDAALELLVVMLDEEAGQRQDVFAPLAQRRNQDLDDV
jgi:hypothetical protein